MSVIAFPRGPKNATPPIRIFVKKAISKTGPIHHPPPRHSNLERWEVKGAPSVSQDRNMKCIHAPSIQRIRSSSLSFFSIPILALVLPVVPSRLPDDNFFCKRQTQIAFPPLPNIAIFPSAPRCLGAQSAAAIPLSFDSDASIPLGLMPPDKTGWSILTDPGSMFAQNADCPK